MWWNNGVGWGGMGGGGWVLMTVVVVAFVALVVVGVVALLRRVRMPKPCSDRASRVASRVVSNGWSTVTVRA